MTNPMAPYITPLLNGEALVAPGKLSTVFKVDDGLEIHFHNDVVRTRVQRKNGVEIFHHAHVGTIVRLVWEVVAAHFKDSDIDGFYIYYTGNVISLKWGIEVHSTVFADPYAKVKRNLAARDAAIKKKRKEYYGGLV